MFFLFIFRGEASRKLNNSDELEILSILSYINSKSSSKEDIKSKKTIENKSNEKIEHIMYVTKSGKKYHRKGCVYLKPVGESYLLKEAEALGCEACSRY